MFIRFQRAYDWVRSFWVDPIVRPLDQVLLDFNDKKIELKNLYYALFEITQNINRTCFPAPDLVDVNYLKQRLTAEEFLEKRLTFYSDYISKPHSFFDTYSTEPHYLNKDIEESICKVFLKKCNPMLVDFLKHKKEAMNKETIVLLCMKGMELIETLLDAIARIVGGIRWYFFQMDLFAKKDSEQEIDKQVNTILKKIENNEINPRIQEMIKKANETGVDLKLLLTEELRKIFHTAFEKTISTTLAQKIHEHGISLEPFIANTIAELTTVKKALVVALKLDLLDIDKGVTKQYESKEEKQPLLASTTPRLHQMLNITSKLPDPSFIEHKDKVEVSKPLVGVFPAAEISEDLKGASTPALLREVEFKL